MNEDRTCERIGAGSGDGDYHVYVNMEYLRKTTCDCLLDNGNKSTGNKRGTRFGKEKR